MSRKTVAAVLGAAMMGASLIAAPVAWADSPKHTFNDVTLPDGQNGEIEATVHIKQNRPDKVSCSYFTADYQDSLGYYFAEEESGPTGSDAVLTYCLDHYDDRHA